MRAWRAWWLAARPKTLTAAVAPVLVGTGVAWHRTGGVRGDVLFYALVAATAIQVATNLFNDALDFRRGVDREGRLGPLRVTQAGLLSPRAVLLGGGAACAVALLAGLPLVFRGGWPILVIGTASLLLAYLYTGGPRPLAHTGLAELAVLLFFGFVAVGGVYYLHTGRYDGAAALAGFQVGALCTVILLVNNLRDAATDRRSGKTTLVVRLGTAVGRRLAALCTCGPFLAGAAWIGYRAPAAAVLPVLSLPLLAGVVRGLKREPPGPGYNRLLARAAAGHGLFGLLLTLGLVL